MSEEISVKSKTKTNVVVKATRILVISLLLTVGGGGVFAAYAFLTSSTNQQKNQPGYDENMFKFGQKWSTTLPEVNMHNAPLIADIDNDEKQEVIATLGGKVVGDRGKGIIYVLEDDGSIKNGWPVDPEPEKENIISTSVIGDINNDNQPEIIAAVIVKAEGGWQFWTTGIPKIFAYNYQGELLAGFPILVSEYADAIETQADLATADFNGDNINDIVFSYYHGVLPTQQQIHIFNNEGEHLNGWPINLEKPGSPLAIGDLDQDGDTELVIGTGEGIYVLNSDGTIAPGWPQGEELGSFEDVPVTIGDIDGNGDLEIVTSTWDQYHHLVVYHHTGEKILDIELPYDSEGFHTRHETALTDLDSDGDLELLIPRMKSYGYDGYSRAWVDAYHHNGQYVEGWPVSYEGMIGAGEEENLVVGNIDGDIDVEIIMGSFTLGDDPDVPEEYRKKAFIYAWNHDGTLVGGFPRIYNDSVGYEGTGLVLTDIEQDGKIDLVMSRWANDFSHDPKTQITVFGMENDYQEKYMEWPMYHKDIAHTGAY